MIIYCEPEQSVKVAVNMYLRRPDAYMTVMDETTKLIRPLVIGNGSDDGPLKLNSKASFMTLCVAIWKRK